MRLDPEVVDIRSDPEPAMESQNLPRGRHFYYFLCWVLHEGLYNLLHVDMQGPTMAEILLFGVAVLGERRLEGHMLTLLCFDKGRICIVPAYWLVLPIV